MIWQFVCSILVQQGRRSLDRFAEFPLAKSHLSDPNFLYLAASVALSSEIKMEITKKLKRAKEGNLVAAVNNLLEFLEAKGLLYVQQIHSGFVGCHPDNRDGLGVLASHCHELLDDLLELGWVHSEARGLCVELPSTQERSIREFNAALSRGSNSKLAPWPEVHQLNFATLWASHTNQVLRLVRAGMEHDGKAAAEICSNGRLSLELLRKKDPSFAEAADRGITWRVISKLVIQEFPEFCSLVQSAGKAVGSIMQSESELQICRKILAACGAQQITSYEAIKNQLFRSRPRNGVTIPFLFTFCVKFGGGSSGHLLLQTEDFVKAHGRANRSLGAEFWDSLGAEAKNDSRVLFRHCILKLAYTHASDKFVTISDIRKALSPAFAKRVKDAEEVLQTVDGLASQAVIPPEERVRVVGGLECDLAQIVLEKNKGKDVHERLGSIEAAGSYAVQQINGLISDGAQLQCPWGSSGSSGSQKASTSQFSPSKVSGAVGLLIRVLGYTTLCIGKMHTRFLRLYRVYIRIWDTCYGDYTWVEMA